MKKYDIQLKSLGLFFTAELFIIFICSLLNLFGLNSSITTILLLILNISLFLFLGFRNGLLTFRKGYLSGILTGLALLLILFFINLLFFKGDFNINKVIYYMILLLSSTIGGMFGKARKKED